MATMEEQTRELKKNSLTNECQHCTHCLTGSAVQNHHNNEHPPAERKRAAFSRLTTSTGAFTEPSRAIHFPGHSSRLKKPSVKQSSASLSNLFIAVDHVKSHRISFFTKSQSGACCASDLFCTAAVRGPGGASGQQYGESRGGICYIARG